MKTDHATESQVHAENLFRAGKFGDSNSTLLSLMAEDGETSYRCFCIGRNFRYMGNLADAESWLLKALSFPKYYPWSLYELSLTEEQAGRIKDAAGSMDRFLGTADPKEKSRKYNPTQKLAILRVAHALFPSDRALSIKIYKQAQDQDIEDYRSALRIIESRIDSDDPDMVFADMSALRSKYSLDSWGLLALSRVHQRRGEIAEAREALRNTLERYPGDAFILGLTCHRYIEMALYDEAEGLVRRLREEVRNLGDQEKGRAAGVEFRLSVRRHDCEGVARLLADKAIKWPGIEKRVLVEAMFEFALPRDVIQPAEVAIIDQLHDVIRGAFRGTLPEVHALLHYYLRTRRWSEAEQFLESVKSSPAIYTNPGIVVRRLELRCNAGDLAGAAEIYRAHLEGTELSNAGCSASIRFLAEQKRWEDAATVLRQGIRSGYTFPDQEHLMLQIARRSEMREEFLHAIDESMGAGAHRLPGELINLRQLLIDDLCIGANRLTFDSRAGEKHALSSENNILVSHEPPSRQASASTTALFLCTDKNYFFSVLTFLASYAMHNRENIKTFVFLGDDVPKAWGRLLKEFAAKIRIDLEAVPERTFLASDISHSESYGIFTGGFSLSRAAYFRIYAARYLQGLRTFRRLCYIDSDIICQGDLSDLFNFELGGSLLAARCEEVSPEVREAAVMNSLDPHGYFNSGVLLIDVSREETTSCLDRAVDLSEREPSRLTYHDQCALNIAFEGQSTPLPPELNFFLRPHRADNGDFTAAKLVHFLSRPKPWDVSFSRDYRNIWSRHAEVVRLLLQPQEYSQLVIQANGGTPAIPADAPVGSKKVARSRGRSAPAVSGRAAAKSSATGNVSMARKRQRKAP